MTILEAMREHALAQFDSLVAEREAEVRSAMKTAGCPRAEIDAHIAECRTRIAEERKAIPGNVVLALMKQGIDLELPADVWS